MNSAELADAAAIFVVVRVKSNLRGSQRERREKVSPAATHLREHLRELADVRRDAACVVLGERRKKAPNTALAGQGRQYLLSVLLTGFGNRRTCCGKVLRVHNRPERDFCVEREKPRLRDRRYLR